MLMYQKTMFDRYYCMKSFCHLKTLLISPMHITVDDINFCDGLECVYAKYKAMHQQHVNCLINTWVSAC